MSGNQDGTIRLWDTQTWEAKNSIGGHTGDVKAVAFSSDGQTIASGNTRHTIHLWDAKTGEHKNTLTGHGWTVAAVAFSPDGSILASGSWDNNTELVVVMGSIPCPFDERPKTFHCVGMYPPRFPFLAPVQRFMLHLFTDLVVSFIRVGIEFGGICFHKLLDKLRDGATFGILNKFSDDFPASCDRTKHCIFRCATSAFTGFATRFIGVFLAFATDIGFVGFNNPLESDIILPHLRTDRHH